MNVSYSHEYDSVTLTCPQCESTVEIDKHSFLDMLAKPNEQWECDDCKCVYTVTTTLLDPRGLTLREPEPAFAGAVEYCRHIAEKIDGTCPFCDLPKPPRS